MTDNPWSQLPPEGPCVLRGDRPPIADYNARLPAGSPFRIITEGVVPEPFIGAAQTAAVLVLQLNPGFDESNVASHADPAFRVALLANLRHASSEWPLYYFDPRFRSDHPGGRWWTAKTRQLAREVPLRVLAQMMAIVEWFPYRSARFKPGCRVPSQAYGFALVSAAIARKALIVVSRSVSLWQESVPGLAGYPRQLTLSSAQNVALTPNNLLLEGHKQERAWALLIEALAG